MGDGSSSPALTPDGQTNAKKTPLVQNKPQPSMLNKMTAGTKKFFGSVGDALTFKKSPPKNTNPTNPWFKPPKEEPKPSWFSSIFHKEEPKKPSNPSEWIEQKRLD